MRLVVLGMLAVCATPKSTFSSSDRKIFETPPVIVIEGDETRLEWKYGTSGYAFRPLVEVVEDQVVFWLPAVASELAEAGATGRYVVVDEQAVRLIERGAVFWLESDGELTKLEVERPYPVPQ